MMANFGLLLSEGMNAVGNYRLDTEKLKNSPTRIVIGVGQKSEGQVSFRAASALAKKLGTNLVDFLGDHGGFASEPKAFAEVLRSQI